jgi:hypothetical protein
MLLVLIEYFGSNYNNMKKIWVITVLILAGCQNNRQIIQSITKASVTICWYRESYLTGTRAFVSFTGADDKETILFSNNDITTTNIDTKSDSLIISGYHMDSLEMAKVQKTIDGYKIILRKATYREWVNHYHPGGTFQSIKGADD